jgi:hypothetical protein
LVTSKGLMLATMVWDFIAEPQFPPPTSSYWHFVEAPSITNVISPRGL